jgi:Glycine cleavage system P-protein
MESPEYSPWRNLVHYSVIVRGGLNGSKSRNQIPTAAHTRLAAPWDSLSVIPETDPSDKELISFAASERTSGNSAILGTLLSGHSALHTFHSDATFSSDTAMRALRSKLLALRVARYSVCVPGIVGWKNSESATRKLAPPNNLISSIGRGKTLPLITTKSEYHSTRAIALPPLSARPEFQRRWQHSQAQERSAEIDYVPTITALPEWIRPQDTLPRRHIGPSDAEIDIMLKELKQPNLDAFIRQTIPDSIRAAKPFTIPSEQTAEMEMLDELTKAGKANSAAEVDTYIGMGYHPTITPGVIQRNVLENPGWYTSYTPYQPEISQGTLPSENR